MKRTPQEQQEWIELKDKINFLADREAIRDLLSLYGFAFDLGCYDRFYDLWTEDAVFKTDGPEGEIRMNGKAEIVALFGTSQSKYTASQHLQLEYVIDVEGDTAVAVGYQLITVHKEEHPRIDRTGIRRFRFQRIDEKWRIKEAISRTMKNRESCLTLLMDKVGKS